jgi:tungstate transport system ATP-binding protein
MQMSPHSNGQGKEQSLSILPLVADQLCFEAGGQLLLDGISFKLDKGGVTAIIGPNGAGKSLILRLCHGLLQPTSGAVHWAAGNGKSGGVKRHAMVFQHPVMLRRSARGNIVHALRATGMRISQPIVDAALDRFGLAALGERPARLLSGGEQQRLAIARAWLLQPDVLFMDEPSSQLDPGATRQIEQIIAGLAQDGMTIIMTTHNLGQAKRLSQRVIFIARGRVVEDAASADFFASPETAEGVAYLAGDLIW